jgi:acyl-CoA reductase-like NAD-dependent aldehyde dehydrogenase
VSAAGVFVEPTIVARVSREVAIGREEEVFGSVLAVLTFRTLDEATEPASPTPYRRSSAVWS